MKKKKNKDDEEEKKMRKNKKPYPTLKMSQTKAHDFYEIIKNSLKLMWRRMRKFLQESSI